MKDMRLIVKQGYEKGDYYSSYRKNRKIHPFEKFLFDKLRKVTPKGKLLDLGCGLGVPFDKYFVEKGYEVTGIDISQKHIAVAKTKVKAKFIKGDFSKYNFKNKFDIIVSFFAIFHIPREEHFAIFKKMYSLLNSQGHILITLGKNEEEMYVTENFVGSKMAWSSHSPEKSLKLLKKAGFKIILSKLESITHKGEETHLWILAKKLNNIS